MHTLFKKNIFLKYGTTLRGLMINHNIEAYIFLSYVHDINLTSIKKNLDLKEEMRRI